jgi:hypothetical protein
MWLWFVQTKAGRAVAGAFSAVVLVALVLWRVFAAGKRAESQKQTEDSLKNLRERAAVDDTISKLSDTDRRHHLRDWVRDE